MTRKGFTLIELLVVIAIIAILAAILFPVFAQAREKARSTACLSNTKQLATASGMYVQDYDETFPTWPHHSGPTRQIARPDGTIYDGRVVWPILFYPYIKNQQVFACPSDPQVRTSVGTGWGKPFPMSYGPNARLLRGTGGTATAGGVSLAVLSAPADVYWLADISNGAPIGFESGPVNGCSWNGNPTYGVDRIRFTKDTTNCSGYPQPSNHANPDSSTRHQGGSHIVYADWHVKWQRWQNITWQGTCPTGLNTAGTSCAAVP